jgi:TRAP-type C4-dicarboxylate transport system substrate-binding protein
MNSQRALAVLFGLAAGLAIASGQALAQTRWNLPSGYPADNPHVENLIAFAKDVSDATNDGLKITVHAGASLFAAPGIKRAVATGQAQVGEIFLSIHENEDPVYGIDVVPFLATSFTDAEKLWAASRKAIEEKLAAQQLIVLFAVPWAPQGIFSKNAINTVADMKGLKWRAYNAGTARIGELVGAQSVTIQAAELPQALATGAVNAFISAGATGYDSKVWESMNYFYDLQAWIPKNVVVVNKAAFDALDKETQEAVMKAANDAEVRGWRLWKEKSQWYLDEIGKRGVKVLRPSPELLSGLKMIGEQLAADWLKRAGPNGQAIVDAYRRM